MREIEFKDFNIIEQEEIPKMPDRVPCCPHCGEGMFPSDKHGIWECHKCGHYYRIQTWGGTK